MPRDSTQTVGEAPLSTLLAIAEEEVRQIGERLADKGIAVSDPTTASLIATVRARLLVAQRRAEGLC